MKYLQNLISAIKVAGKEVINMENLNTSTKQVYKKPSIKSEQLEMNVLASHGGGTCTCNGKSQSSFIQNAVSHWMS